MKRNLMSWYLDLFLLPLPVHHTRRGLCPSGGTVSGRRSSPGRGSAHARAPVVRSLAEAATDRGQEIRFV